MLRWLAAVFGLETEGGGMNLWGKFVGVVGTDRCAGRFLGAITGVETLEGTGLTVETRGGSITDERGISVG